MDSMPPAPSSKRFLTPSEMARRRPERAWGGREVFPEGLWSALAVQLEQEGWNPSQIDKIHNQLRQGWPLSLACRNVASMSGSCPIRGHRAALQPPEAPKLSS